MFWQHWRKWYFFGLVYNVNVHVHLFYHFYNYLNVVLYIVRIYFSFYYTSIWYMKCSGTWKCKIIYCWEIILFMHTSNWYIKYIKLLFDCAFFFLLWFFICILIVACLFDRWCQMRFFTLLSYLRNCSCVHVYCRLTTPLKIFAQIPKTVHSKSEKRVRNL